MSIASRLAQVEEFVRGIGNALRLQGRRVSASAPADNELLGWNATTKKWEPKSSAPSARVYNDASISISVDNDTALTFNQERFDTDSIHDTGSNTSRLTCKTAGKYLIIGNIVWAQAGSGAKMWVSIRLNGSTLLGGTADWAEAMTNLQSVSTLYDLAVDDYVELVVRNETSGAVNVLAASNYSPEFMMTRLGPRGSASGAVGDDHGTLTGLGDDDHTQYLLAVGTRALTGNLAVDAGITIDGIDVGAHGDAYNGSLLEPMTFVITSNGTTITGTIDKNPSGDLTERFSDGYTTLLSGATVTLIVGSATVPKKNYVYVLQSNKGVLVASDSDWPTTEHIKVAEVVVQTASLVQSNGILANRNWDDHAKETSGMGHHLDAWKRLRWEHAAYKSGSAVTWSGSGTAALDLAISAGQIYQMHLHIDAAFDTTDPDNVYVVNHPTAYTITPDIETLVVDSGNVSLSNRYYNLVIWRSVSSGSEEEQVFINLPSGSYKKQSDAENDVSGYDNFAIPTDYRGYAYLVQRVTIKHSTAGGGTWTIHQETDLRGTVPSIAVGGGTLAITTEFADSAFKIFDDGDPTKEIAFQASSISASTTRTVTVPDKDLTLIDTADAIAAVEGEATLDLTGDVSIADGKKLTLQEAIDFIGATTENRILMPDDLALALGFFEGATAYMTFVTTNGSEQVSIFKNTLISGALQATSYGGITEANLVDKSAAETIAGRWDFGGAASLEIPNGAAPVVDAAGEIAIDTTIADHTGLITYHDGAEALLVIAIPVANLTTTDGHVVAYNAANNEFEMVAAGGGGGGDVTGIDVWYLGVMTGT